MEANPPIHERLEGASSRITDECFNIETLLWAIGAAIDDIWNAPEAAAKGLQVRADCLTTLCTEAAKRIATATEEVDKVALALFRARAETANA